MKVGGTRFGKIKRKIETVIQDENNTLIFIRALRTVFDYQLDENRKFPENLQLIILEC